jgi:hypothetical protein
VSCSPSGPPSEYTRLQGSSSSSGPGCRKGGISWCDVKAAGFSFDGDVKVINRLFDILLVSRDDVQPVLLHAASVSQSNNEAQAFGAGDVAKASMVLSRSASETDVSLIRCDGNLALVAKEARIARGVSDIRCLVGCERNVVDKEVVSIIDGYAQGGVTLPHAVTFVPSSVSQVFPKLRNLSRRVYPAILSLVANLVDKGQAVVLPRITARELPGANSMPIHWVPKVGDPLGRLIADASGGLYPPNGVDDSLRDTARDMYGPIVLPREVEVATFLLKGVSDLRNPVLSVDDVAGAFSRLWLSHETAVQSMLDVSLADGTDVSVVLTSMYFGGTPCPYAWNPVSTALSQLLHARNMPNRMYVDDILRIGESASASIDGESTRDLICSVLTPGCLAAWAAGKANWGKPRLDFIGWTWDIVSLTVELTRRTVVRFVCRILDVLLAEHATVSQLQGIASLGARVSTVLSALKPLAFVVYSAFAGTNWRRSDATIQLSPLVRATLSWWLHLLVSAWNTGRHWSTPLYRIVVRQNTVSLQFDGSTTGVGGVSPALHSPDRGPAGQCTIPFAYRVVYDVGWSSSEQNTSELIGILFGVSCLVRLGLRGDSVRLVGDSQVALSWTNRGIKSLRAFRTYLLLQAIVLEGGFTFGESTLISSAENSIPDKLSRDVTVNSISCLAGHKSNVLRETWIQDVMVFVNPLTPFGVGVIDMASDYARADELTRCLFDCQI